MQFLSDYWLMLLSFIGLQFILVIVLKTFPEILVGTILKSIEARNETALEKTKDDLARQSAQIVEKLKDDLARTSARDIENLRAEYLSLRASTDYLSANQAELRSKMVQATDTLWKAMIALHYELGGLVHIETILLPGELADMFERGKHPFARNYYAGFNDQEHVLKKVQSAMSAEVEACRLFVSFQTWLLFYVYRASLGRVAYMAHTSLTTSKYTNWRTDEPILNMLRSVLPAGTIETVLKSSLPSLKLVLDQLEAHFLREAARTMVGSSTLADNISDVHATMALQTTRVRENEEERRTSKD